MNHRGYDRVTGHIHDSCDEVGGDKAGRDEVGRERHRWGGLVSAELWRDIV